MIFWQFMIFPWFFDEWSDAWFFGTRFFCPCSCSSCVAYVVPFIGPTWLLLVAYMCIIRGGKQVVPSPGICLVLLRASLLCDKCLTRPHETPQTRGNLGTWAHEQGGYEDRWSSWKYLEMCQGGWLDTCCGPSIRSEDLLQPTRPNDQSNGVRYSCEDTKKN